MGVIFSLDGRRTECLPVGEQRLSDDGRFRYLGGAIPAEISSRQIAQIEEVVVAACRTIPGLAGYFGVDLLLTDGGQPVIVEINPRLTTAYVGYRQLFAKPLPEHWLLSQVPSPSPIPKARRIEFDAG